MYKVISILFLSYISTQSLIFSPNNDELIDLEINAIQNNEIKISLYRDPFLKNNSHINKSYNLLSKFSNQLSLQPTFATRYSQFGFEINEDQIESNAIWISPGVRFEFIKPLISSFMNVWIYAYSDYQYNHAYGTSFLIKNFDKENLFKISPYFSAYWMNYSDWPKEGVVFDQNQSVLSLLSNNFKITFGKFSPRYGPFLMSNLSISGDSPSITQLNYQYKSDKIEFSFMVGQLESLIDENNSVHAHSVPRYSFYHRIDLHPERWFRISFYELLITGGNKLNWSYFSPIAFFWGSQHEGNDKDNIMLGLDFELLASPYRIYGSFIMDEWSPGNTFDPENHRNWFGFQLGLSRLISLFSKECLMKIEYSHLEPQVYTHDVERNLPEHFSFPIGYWSGGHSNDLFVRFHSKISDKHTISINYQNTKKGIPLYSDQIVFSPDFWSKETIFIEYNYDIIPSILVITSRIKNIKSNLFDNENRLGIEMTCRYNINY